MEKKTILKGFGIVVVARGWVFVGDIEDDGNETVITNCKNIRRWGTSKGLGQLAAEGPQEETKLDPCETVRVPSGSKVFIMESDKSLWK